MDQYWVWMRRRQILNSINKDSREEKAIMEDASDQLGGCIWPPRSYSCSFCRREFRSAQALGGHMNVHRRDRARLKQSLSPCNNIDTPFQHQNPIQIASTPPLKSMDSLFSPEICTLDYDLDLTSSRVSAQESLNHDQHSTIASSFSSFSRVQEQPKACPNSMSKLHVSSSSPRGEDLTRLSNNISNTIAANLFMGLKPTKSTTVLRDDHKAISDNCKRLKTTVSTLSFLMNPCSNDKCSLQLGVVGENPSSIEDIDLELRLGELPKVK